MRKIAIAIEQAGAGAPYKVTSEPTEDVASVLAAARAASIARGGGEGTLIVLTTNGIEKRYKIGSGAVKPQAVKKGAAR